ncbi:conserved hypothetical protein, partial [Ricinus communis]
MRHGDLGRDEQAQAQPLPARRAVRTPERLEQLRLRVLGNRRPAVADPQLEQAVHPPRADPHRRRRAAVDDGVFQQVGQHLHQPRRVTGQRHPRRQLGHDLALRMHAAQLVNGLLQRPFQVVLMTQVQRDAAAHATTREVGDVVDHRGDAVAAALHGVQQRHQRGRRAVAQYLGAVHDGAERRAQVVPQHGDELLAQLGGPHLVAERGLRLVQHHLAMQLPADEVGKQHQRVARGFLVEFGSLLVQAAQRAEVRAAGTVQRDREIAFEAVQARRVVVAVLLALADGVDDDGAARVLHFVAQRSRNVELATGRQAVAQLVQYSAGMPRRRRHPRDADEPQAGQFGHRLQYRRHGADLRDRCDIRVQ